LFGLYTYDIAVPGSTGQKGPSLLILYGDNGTGKTTVLQLVYRLLAKEENRGHRTFLARVPFRSLVVRLDSGYIVEASRAHEELVGGYQILVKPPSGFEIRAEALVDDRLVVKSSEFMSGDQQARWRQYLQALADLDITFFFFADDRRSHGPKPSADPDRGLEYEVERVLRGQQWRSAAEERDGLIQDAVAQLEAWIRDEALKGANVGEATTNTVYADVARRIAKTRRPGRPPRAASAPLAEDLAALEARSKPFAALGLVAPPRLSEILLTLEKSPAGTRKVIANVIEPYVDALRARLDALQALQELLTQFLISINSFFANKVVTYSLGRGLQIRPTQGAPLRPTQLSSGEQQLLLLLAQVMTARQAATVFLIDEPEISLNVKWQRNLVDTLLSLVAGSEVQFILATHSLELLATHRENIVRLAPSVAESKYE
jgi:energy-coupling factor transporter ATP-binding protein EcfA2